MSVERVRVSKRKQEKRTGNSENKNNTVEEHDVGQLARVHRAVIFRTPLNCTPEHLDLVGTSEWGQIVPMHHLKKLFSIIWSFLFE